MDGDGQRFSGKVAIVTGGANGIGAATVRRLAADGAAVVIADVETDAGTRLAEETGGTVTFVRCDVASEFDWEPVVEAARSLRGMDIVVTNAFLVRLMPAGELPLADWHRQIDVCLTHVYLAIRATGRALAERRGSMVCVSSIHAHAGFASHPAYAAAKGGSVPWCGNLPSSTVTQSASTRCCPALSQPGSGRISRTKTDSRSSTGQRCSGWDPQRRWRLPSCS